MRSFALTSNLYPETTIKPGTESSQNFQSRSTLHSLKGVAAPSSTQLESGRATSRQTSLNRELSNNQMFQHQRRLSNEHDPDLDLKSFTIKSLEDDDFGFKSRFSSQVLSTFYNKSYLVMHILHVSLDRKVNNIGAYFKVQV